MEDPAVIVEKSVIADENNNHVYLVQPSEYIGTTVFKLGITLGIKSLMSRYGKDKIIYHFSRVTNREVTEKKLIKEFNKRYKIFRGNEYFSGDINDMLITFQEVVLSIEKAVKAEKSPPVIFLSDGNSISRDNLDEIFSIFKKSLDEPVKPIIDSPNHVNSSPTDEITKSSSEIKAVDTFIPKITEASHPVERDTIPTLKFECITADASNQQFNPNSNDWHAMNILGYSRYSITRKGIVKNNKFQRLVEGTFHQMSGKTRMKLTNDDGHKVNEYLSRLMAKMFLPSPFDPSSAIVLFHDSNMLNCELSNLYWARDKAKH